MFHAMPFSARALKKTKNIFFDVDIVVKNKSNVVKRCLTTMMTHIVVDRSTDNAKPH